MYHRRTVETSKALLLQEQKEENTVNQLASTSMSKFINVFEFESTFVSAA